MMLQVGVGVGFSEVSGYVRVVGLSMDDIVPLETNKVQLL
jgi:hypothetical protein